jgi:hypothetical protein
MIGAYAAQVGPVLPTSQHGRVTMANGEQRSNKEKKKPKKDAKTKAAAAVPASLMSKGQTEPVTKKKG